MKQSWNSKKAVSITELLIVVTVIGVLAVISTANFKKAQTASEVAEAKKLLRYTAVALEAYNINHGIYPYDGFIAFNNSSLGLEGHNYLQIGISMTTPIAYLPHIDLVDPFLIHQQVPDNYFENRNIRYFNTTSVLGTNYSEYTGRTEESEFYHAFMNGVGKWTLSSTGPDVRFGQLYPGWEGFPDHPNALAIPYDPTNGLISKGDIIRSQKYTKGYYNVH